MVDAYTRECLALEVDTSFPSRRMTRVLDNLMAARGRPAGLRSDNGPEMCSRHYLAWCLDCQVQPTEMRSRRHSTLNEASPGNSFPGCQEMRKK